MNTRKDLMEYLPNYTQYYVRTYSPGDGMTRYRFFEKQNGEETNSYFGPGNGIYTALGLKEALAYASGLIA